MFSFSFTQHETAHNGIVNRPQELLLFSLLPVILSYSRPTTGSVVASVWPHVHRPVWRHPSITLLFSLRLIIPLLSKAWFVTPSVSRSHFSLGERDRRRNETGRQLENEEGKWRVLGETSKRHFQRKDERRRKEGKRMGKWDLWFKLTRGKIKADNRSRHSGSYSEEKRRIKGGRIDHECSPAGCLRTYTFLCCGYCCNILCDSNFHPVLFLCSLFAFAPCGYRKSVFTL